MKGLSNLPPNVTDYDIEAFQEANDEWSDLEVREAELANAKRLLRGAQDSGNEDEIRHWQGVLDELGGRGWLRKFIAKRKG